MVAPEDELWRFRMQSLVITPAQPVEKLVEGKAPLSHSHGRATTRSAVTFWLS